MRILAKNLTKIINNKVIFENVSFEIEKGILLVKGRNGSGKTTLLRILAGFERLTSGKIVYEDIKNFEISYLGHKLGIYLELSVRENLDFFSFNQELIGIFELDKFLNYKAKFLSRGNLQKLAIVRTLSKEAKLYLLDEPFVSLDESSKEKLLSLIKEMAENKIFIITSHENIGFYNQMLSLSH